MSDPVQTSLAKANINAALNAVTHLGTNWQTSAIGMAFVVLGAASYFGVNLPVVGGVQLEGSQLILAGLGALGFFAAKDANK